MKPQELILGTHVFDPRGKVETATKTLAPRVPSLDGLRLGVLENSKWNGSKLLRNVVKVLEEDYRFARVERYTKESFSKPAAAELVEEIARESDIVVTAIGD